MKVKTENGEEKRRTEGEHEQRIPTVNGKGKQASEKKEAYKRTTLPLPWGSKGQNKGLQGKIDARLNSPLPLQGKVKPPGGGEKTKKPGNENNRRLAKSTRKNLDNGSKTAGEDSLLEETSCAKEIRKKRGRRR